MEAALTNKNNMINVKTILFDIIFITAIYFVPVLSHSIGIPFYLLEPMRIILVLSMAHTNRYNAYFLAITLPLVSFFISGHPVIPKVLLVVFELVVNVWCYYFFLNRIKKVNWLRNFEIRNYEFGLSLFISIIMSKTIYYLLKYLLIQLMLFESGVFSTPLYIQLTIAFLLSVYLLIARKKKNIPGEN